jgi:outer membrane immunogenic protein
VGCALTLSAKHYLLSQFGVVASRWELRGVRKLLVVISGIVLAGLSISPATADGDSYWHRSSTGGVFTWTGCYLGLQLGYGFGDTSFNGQFVDSAVPSTFGTSTSVIINPSNPMIFGTSGVFGGGQGGCDYQLARNWVIGVAADASGANINGNSVQTGSVTLVGFPTPAPTNYNASGTLSSNTDFIATATARLGYSIGQSPFYWGGQGLFYVKGGAAWARYNYSFNGSDSTTVCVTFTTTCTSNATIYGLFNFSGYELRTGWTVGVGTEWMITGNWSVNAEYDFLEFGTRNVSLSDTVLGADQFSVRQDINEVKLGINYRFQ